VLGPDGLSRLEKLSRREGARTAILRAFDGRKVTTISTPRAMPGHIGGVARTLVRLTGSRMFTTNGLSGSGAFTDSSAGSIRQNGACKCY
jgi:hypothetical protein